MLIEVGLASKDDLRIDYKRGILFYKRSRIGEEKENKFALNGEIMKKVNIVIEKDAIDNAVNELLSE